MNNRVGTKGFTIVELLIVIVVIGILAAITIVAFNGVQQRAKYSTMKQDIAAIEKVIKLYYADNGEYPATGTAHGNTTDLTTIVGVVPKYTTKLPTFPAGSVGYYAYILGAGGQEYKIVRLVGSGVTLPTVEQGDPKPDTTRPDRGWGVWSPGGATL